MFANFFKSFGGGGAFGGDDDDGFGAFGGPSMMFGSPFMNGMGGGMMGGMMGRKRPFVSEVRCTLEELFHGTVKKLKITRQCHTPGRDRGRVFEVQVRLITNILRIGVGVSQYQQCMP